MRTSTFTAATATALILMSSMARAQIPDLGTFPNGAILQWDPVVDARVTDYEIFFASAPSTHTLSAPDAVVVHPATELVIDLAEQQWWVVMRSLASSPAGPDIRSVLSQEYTFTIDSTPPPPPPPLPPPGGIRITIRAAALIESESQIGASADDAEEVVGVKLDITSQDLDIGDAQPGGPQQLVGLRFPQVALPRGANIQSAHVEFLADEFTSGAASISIRGEISSDAQPFNRSARISTRHPTVSGVTWRPAAWHPADESHRTPDVAPILNEIAAHPAWTEGSAVVLMLGGPTNFGSRVAKSWDADPGAGARLHIEYLIFEETVLLLAPGSTVTVESLE